MRGYLAYLSSSEIKTRNERAMNVKNSEFMERFQKERTIKLVEFLLDKYAEQGIKEFDKGFSPLIELSSLGSASEVVQDFGGIQELRQSIEAL